MVVYLDIILLLNLLINTLLLWFTAYFRKERIVWWRILLAAGVGSGYVAFFFLPSFSGLYQWSVKFLFSVIILLIAFGFRRLRSFLQNLCMFYFVAFVFGGGVLGLHYFLESQSEVVEGIVSTHNDGFGVASKPQFLVLLLGFVLIYFLSRRSYQAIQEPRRLEEFFADVVVQLQGESIICRGLVDTGNQLYEPITRIPVMILESQLLQHRLPEAVFSHLMTAGEQRWEQWQELLDNLPAEWQSRVRLIPYRSVSRGMDLLLALKPDRVKINQNGRRVETERVLIGLNPLPLSAERKYQAIVHPALLQTEGERYHSTIEQEG